MRDSLVGLLALAAALAAAPAAGCGRDAAQTPPAPAPGSPPPAAQAELPELTVADVAGRIARGERLAVYDVNGREKYEAGHVPGARWASSRSLQASDLPPDRSTPLVFYCANEH